MRSSVVLLMSFRICAFSGGMSFLHAFFSSSHHFRNLRPLPSNLKAFQSSSSRDQLLTNTEPLFNTDFSLFQNTVESLRLTWECIHEFESTDDSLTRMFSADGFQNGPEYSIAEELEVVDARPTMQPD